MASIPPQMNYSPDFFSLIARTAQNPLVPGERVPPLVQWV
jgi:hypothetical protein